MDFQKFSLELQAEMQAAAAEAEALGAQCKSDIERAATALMEKADVIRHCENHALETTADFFSKNEVMLKTQFREAMLINAIQKLHRVGKSPGDIGSILGLDAAFIDKHTVQ